METKDLGAITRIEEVSAGRRDEPGSISPLVADARLRQALADAAPGAPVVQRRVPRRDLRAVVAASMVACLTILFIAALRSYSDPRPGEAGAVAAPAIVAAAALPRPLDSTPWNAPPIASTPRGTGTITAAAGLATWSIDGKPIKARSIALSCGQHELRIGRGAPRAITVPCGGTLIVDRGGKTTLR
jgi:hypothetical protein